MRVKKPVIALIVFTAILGTVIFARNASYTEDVSAQEGIKVPIIMYHSIRADSKYLGKYVVSPRQLEDDFKYLKEHGYTPVSIAELTAFISGSEASLPEKPILLTFDDGYYNNYVYAYELLKKYNFKALISIVGIYSEKQSVSGEAQSNGYSHLSWEQLKEMTDSELVEIGHHSYNMHTNAARAGANKKSGESSSAYAALLTEDILALNSLLSENGVALAPVYAYPFGAYCLESETTVKALGFKASLSCEEGINVINKNSSLYLLKRFNRPHGKTSADYFEKIGVE